MTHQALDADQAPVTEQTGRRPEVGSPTGERRGRGPLGTTMVRVAARNAAAHRVRFVATGLAVLLSVAFMAGTRVLGDTVRSSVDAIWSDAYGHIDVVVRSDRTIGLDGEGRRDRVDTTVVDAVRAVPGVAGVEGSIEANVRVLGPDGAPLRDPGVGPSSWMLDWPSEPDLTRWSLRDGRPPDGPGELVVDPTTATEGRFAVGDPITVVAAGEAVPATVVGIATFGDASSYAGIPAVLADEAWAAELVGQPGRVDRVDVAADDGVAPETLAAAVRAAAVPGTEVLTGAELSEERREAIAEVVDLFVQLVSGFGAIALFVGAFLIVNTFTIIVTQRTRELALLRALGASRGQILTAVLGEAGIVAVVASALGAVAAVGVAAGLRALIGAVGFPVPDDPLVLGVGAFAVPMVLAVVVTGAAAAIPAWRAARASAVDAMRDVTVEEVRRVRLRLVVGVVLAGVAVLVVRAAFGATDETASVLVLAAAVPAIVGFAVAGPVLTPPVVSWLGSPLARLSGVTGRLAQRNALRHPARTSSTAAALVIGVSLVIVITVASSSLATTVGRVVDQTVQGDFVVSGEGGGVSTDVAPALAAVEGVATAAGVRLGVVGIDGDQEFVLAVDPAATRDLVDLEVREGDLDRLGLGTVAVARAQAERDGVVVGDRIEVAFPFGGDTAVEVVAIYEGGLTRNGEYLFAHAGWDPFVPESSRVDARVIVAVAPGVDRDEVEPALVAALEPWPGTDVVDVGTYRDQQVDRVVSRISYLYVLLGLALIVGLLGIANTLLLGVYERTRELGLLRTVGARRGQLRGAILQEAGVIAALGALVGVALGIVLGWAMVETLAFDDRIAVDVPVVTVTAIATAAVAAGVVAGVVPAWRAGRLDLLAAAAET